MITLAELTETCGGCPSQWEGRTTSNEPVYIRYRWGNLTLCIGFPGGDIDNAIRADPKRRLSVGDGLDGCMETDEMMHHLGLRYA